MIQYQLMEKTNSSRVTSIDLFRGYAILNMIFFNDVASAMNVPTWMHHAPSDSNTMTYVDSGVPVFLFIMGMAIPLAFKARMSKGVPVSAIWSHVLLRSLALIVMGTWMVWMSDFDAQAVGVSKPIWALWMYLGFFLLWYTYPKKRVGSVTINPILPFIGGGILSFIAWQYHTGMQTQSFFPEWWGILGTIGWAYLVGCLSYTLFSKFSGWVAIALIIALPQFYALTHVIDGIVPFSTSFLMSSVAVIVGIGLSDWLFVRSAVDENLGKKLGGFVGAALFVWCAAQWHTPSYGISKDAATPGFMLFGIWVGLFIQTIFFILVRFFKGESWLAFFKPAGKLPLTAYLIAEMIYEPITLIGLGALVGPLYGGPAGLLCSAILTALVAYIIYRIARLDLRWGF